MKKWIPVVLLLLALPAAAHPGHVEAAGFFSGLAHPFSGLDHLLAMLGVGIWSRQQGRGLLLPLAFVLMMAVGAFAQTAVPIEMGLAATVVLIGALLLAGVRLPAWLSFSLVAGFAFLHGQAHGRELPQAASAIGFLLASAALLLAGRAIDGARLSRIAGAGIGAAGLYMLAGLA